MQAYEWQVEVPLLTNRFMIYDLGKLVGLTMGLFFIILMVVGIAADGKIDLPALAVLAQVSSWGGLGLLVLMILVMLLFFFNHFPMKFQVSSQGVRVESLSRRGRWGNRLAVVLGALSGRPGVAGAGLLGMAQEIVSLKWTEVHRVKVYPGLRVISLMNSWRVVFRLYCTPDNFAPVMAAVREGLEKGSQTRARAVSSRSRPRTWCRPLGLSLATVAAGLLLGALPLEVPAALRGALTLAGLLAIWLPGRRLWGAAVLVLAAGVLIIFLSRALQTRQMFQEADFLEWARRQGLKVEKVPEWALFKRRHYESFHTGDWLAAGAGGLALAFFGWQGWAGVRGQAGRRADPAPHALRKTDRG